MNDNNNWSVFVLCGTEVWNVFKFNNLLTVGIWVLLKQQHEACGEEHPCGTTVGNGLQQQAGVSVTVRDPWQAVDGRQWESFSSEEKGVTVL